MGNLPIVSDLVVDMDPFWAKFKAMKPYLQPGYDQPEDGREHVISQERMNVIHKESLCINCGCCVSGVQRDGVRARVPRPAGARQGDALRRRPARRRQGRAPRRRTAAEHGIWECTRCYFCNERCPKGVDPRDAIAKLGAEAIKEGIDRDMGAKHANWFVTSAKTTGWLRETELVPKTQGVVSSIKEMKFAMGLGEARQRCRRRSRRTSPERRQGVAGALRPRQGARTARARWGSSRASMRSAGSSTRATRTDEKREEEEA